MKTGIISIIMPVYNGEKYLAQAIASVLAQSYPHWELLVVDDGSVDGTAVIVRQFSDPRIRYHYQENRGQATALNTGLSLAQGEFVTTLDADDWYPPDSLQARIQVLTADPGCAVAYGDGSYCYESGEPFLRFTEQMPAGVTGDVYDTLITSPFYGTGATVLIRRQVLRDHDIRYDDTIVWCQDWDFYVRLAAVASFGFTPANTIFYRMHGEGMTMAMPHGRRLESFIRTKQKILASARFQQAADDKKAAFFYDLLLQDLAGDVTAQEKTLTGLAFQQLSGGQRSRLLRLVAVDYVQQREQTAVARRWLRRAWAAAPADPKTAVVTTLAHISPTLARQVIDRWQGRRRAEQVVSPFETAVTVMPPPESSPP